MMAPTTWLDQSHTRPSARRSRMAKDTVTRLLSPEGDVTNHSPQGMLLPMFVGACIEAGRAFVLTGIPIGGRMAGYVLDTRPAVKP